MRMWGDVVGHDRPFPSPSNLLSVCSCDDVQNKTNRCWDTSLSLLHSFLDLFPKDSPSDYALHSCLQSLLSFCNLIVCNSITSSQSVASRLFPQIILKELTRSPLHLSYLSTNRHKTLFSAQSILQTLLQLHENAIQHGDGTSNTY